MALERWIIDRWELTGQTDRGWEVREGTDEWAGFDGNDSRAVGKRDGALFRRRSLGPGTLTLNMWARGTNKAEVDAEWADVLKTVARRNRQVKITRHKADGTVIYCYGTLVGSAKPTHVGQRGIRAQLVFTIQAGRWFSTTVETVTTTMDAGQTKYLPLPAAAPSTAPLMPEVLLTGPLSSMTIYDYSDPDGTAPGERSRLTYNAPIAAGQTITINTSSWQVTSSTSADPVMEKLTYNMSRFLEVEPAPPGMTPQLRLEASGATTATTVTVKFRPAFLV